HAPEGLHAKGPPAVLRALRVVPLRVCGARLAGGPFACNRGHEIVLQSFLRPADAGVAQAARSVRAGAAPHATRRYVIASGCFLFGGGNAASISARSAFASRMSAAPRFSRTCASDDAFGIAAMPSRASSHARATCAGVAACRVAIVFSAFDDSM